MTGVRVCIDPRLLNKYLQENDHFEIPRINDILANFSGKTMFGEMDLAEAFLQMPLSIDSRKYTAFMWKQQMQFVGCPYGIKHIPSHFQRFMAYLFQDMPFVYPYIDNITFASKNAEEHLLHAKMILDRLNEKNMKLKPGSVNLCHAELQILGRLVNQLGMAISHTKREEVMKWPRPQDGPNLRAFLGFTGFIRDHIRHFADLTAPLEAIKNTKGRLEWTQQLENHFNLIKRAVSNAPFLAHVDWHKRFAIACDASWTGIGGVLYQFFEGQPEDITPYNIIAICSRKLTKSEMRYSAYKKELRGVVYTLLKFHSWIFGREINLYTDHMPLQHMLEQKELSHALQQWFDIIQNYNFNVYHRPGILHVVPDALSRVYGTTYDDTEITWGVQNNIKFIKTAETILSPSDLVVRDSILQSRTAVNKKSRHRNPLSGGGSNNRQQTNSSIIESDHGSLLNLTNIINNINKSTVSEGKDIIYGNLTLLNTL